jgi:hypothetical protein
MKTRQCEKKIKKNQKNQKNQNLNYYEYNICIQAVQSLGNVNDMEKKRKNCSRPKFKTPDLPSTNQKKNPKFQKQHEFFFFFFFI